MPKRLKVGVKQDAGPHEGYRWNVGIIDSVYGEARAFLDAAQYRHLALQVQELARQDDPTHSQTVDVRLIERFHEIRDKGGVLGRLNVRVFFGVDHDARSMIVLGAIPKQNDGPTPLGDKVRMRRRWRKYLNGDYGTFSP